VSILFFRQELDAHGGRQVHGAALGLVFLPRLKGFAVVAKASAAAGTFRGAIIENIFARLPVPTDHVRLPARPFHLLERPQCGGIGFQLGLYRDPLETLVAVPVLLEAGLQCSQELFALLGWRLLLAARTVVHPRGSSACARGR